MNYFIKTIDDPKDQAISTKWVVPSTLPFTILALDGWANPLTISEAEFFLTLMSFLSSGSSNLFACRIATLQQDEYTQEADRVCDKLSLEVYRGWLRRRTSWTAYVVTKENRERFARILKGHWTTTCAGNWLFWDCRREADCVAEVRAVFREYAHNVGNLRHKLLTECQFVGITYDDQLLDCFIKKPREQVESIVTRVGREHGIELSV